MKNFFRARFFLVLELEISMNDVEKTNKNKRLHTKICVQNAINNNGYFWLGGGLSPVDEIKRICYHNARFFKKRQEV